MSELLDKQFEFVKKSFDDGVGTVRAMDIKSNIFIFVSFRDRSEFCVNQ